MTFETRQAYSEVCAVLEYMPDEYVKKIPEKIIKLFKVKSLKITKLILINQIHWTKIT